MKLFFTLLISLLLLSCSGGISREALFTENNLSEAQLITKHSDKGGFYLLLKNDVDMFLTESRSLSYIKNYTSYAYYINEKGEKLTDETFTFRSDRYKLQTIEIITYLPNGEQVELPAENVKSEVTVNEKGYEYTKLSYSFPSVEPNSILYSRIKIGTYDNYYMNFGWYLEHNFPVAKAKFQFFTPDIFALEGNTYSYNFYSQGVNLDKPTIVERRGEYIQRYNRGLEYHYELSNIEPLENLEYSLPYAHKRRYVEFYLVNKEIQGWNDEILGKKEQRSKFKDVFKTSADIKKFVKEHITDKKISAENIPSVVYTKLKEIYRLNTDYIFKGNTSRPNPATETIKETTERVNLKDLSALAVAILRETGLSANIVFLQPFNDGKFYQPKIEKFDLSQCLVVIKKGSKTIWQDYSRNYMKSGLLSSNDQGITALLVNDEAEKIDFVNTPVFPSKDNDQDVVFDLKLNDDFEVSGTVKITLSNTNSLNLRYYKENKTAKEFEEYLTKEIENLTDNVKITDVKLLEITDELASYSAKLTFNDKLKKIGPSRVFDVANITLDPVLKSLKNDKSVRHETFYIYYPRKRTTEINLSYPKGFKPEFKKENASKSDTGVFTRFRTYNDEDTNIMTVKYIIDYKNGDYSPSEYISIQNANEAYQDYSNYKVRLVQN
jgi:hypothetical protein